MAITVIEYSVLINLRKSPLVPKNPHILEIGQQNWYGDVPMEILGAHITEALGDDQDGINKLATQLLGGRIGGVAHDCPASIRVQAQTGVPRAWLARHGPTPGQPVVVGPGIELHSE